MATKHKFTSPDQIIEAAKNSDTPVTDFMWGLWLYLNGNKPLIRKICKLGNYQHTGLGNAHEYMCKRLFEGIAIDTYAPNSYTGNDQ
jgi:hypothetical protein